MAHPVQQLVDHVTCGEVLDLANGQPVDEADLRSWGPERTIPAMAIRDILRRRLATDPDPHGLQLCAARVEGRIDLESLTTDTPLTLADCWLPEGINV
ncbi:hypothetical protein AB0B50_34270 [Streptomyces sp. NPDC041068]|uniref:hypothetical protein n=1 Tax=Streptomyces sp. NPDC041068 TaxID=3155130 RepID=UPI0033FB9A22